MKIPTHNSSTHSQANLGPFGEWVPLAEAGRGLDGGPGPPAFRQRRFERRRGGAAAAPAAAPGAELGAAGGSLGRWARSLSVGFRKRKTKGNQGKPRKVRKLMFFHQGSLDLVVLSIPLLALFLQSEG